MQWERFFLLSKVCLTRHQQFKFFSFILFSLPIYAQKYPITYVEALDHFSEKEDKIILENDALLLSASKFFTADKIIYDKEKDEAELEGHVVGLIEDELLFAEKIKIDLKLKLFTLEKGSLLLGKEEKIFQLKKKILGFRLESSVTEEKRLNQLKKIQNKKNEIYKKTKESKLSEKDKNDFVNEYASLLRQENSLSLQKTIEKSMRNAERNKIWSQASSSHKTYFQKELNGTSYFKIDGSSIKKITKKSYEALDSRLSFCDCEEGETPAWAFRSSKIYFEKGQYASLHNSVLELKGLPVFYLPYIRLPLMNERKIGFLIPSFGVKEGSGFSYKQDFYIPVSDSSEMLIGYNYLSERGLLLDSSFKLLSSDYSFFEISFETLRDRKWLAEKKERSSIIELYQNGLESARLGLNSLSVQEAYKDLYSKDWWKKKGYEECLNSEVGYDLCVKEKIGETLLPAGSAQRGKIEWRGQYRFGEHISFLSDGVFLSDHRYSRDLERGVRSSFLDASLNTRPVKLSGFKNKVALSSPLFTASVSSKIFDPIEGEETYSGYQLPVILNFQSRYISIFNWKFPKIYFRFQYRLKKINLFRTVDKTRSLLEQANFSLGEALMGDASLDFSVPLVFQQVFSLEYFFELQGKHLFNDYSLSLAGKNSEDSLDHFLGIQPSYLLRLKTGLNWGLPIEGFFPIKEELSSINALSLRKIEFGIQHQMSWNIGFYYFSKPTIDGRYGHIFPSYKSSLAKENWVKSSASAFPLLYTSQDKDFLTPQMKVSFKTLHTFSYIKRLVSQTYNDMILPIIPSTNEVDQARRELFSKQASADSLAKIKPYKSFFDSRTIFSMQSELSYDFEKLRKKTGELSYLSSSQVLLNPLSPLLSSGTVYLGFFDMTLRSEYDFYLKAFSNLAFSSNLSLPLDLKLRSGVSLEKKLKDPFSYDLETVRNLVRYSFGAALFFIENSKLSYDFEIHKYENDNDFSFSKQVSLYFQAPSQCWGTKLSWSLPASSARPYGTYIISFFMKFGGNSFDFGNLAAYFQE